MNAAHSDRENCNGSLLEAAEGLAGAMHQVFQDLVSGETKIVELPSPRPGCGELLVRNRQSLVSAGTERILVGFGRAGWVGKARRQPDKVREALQKLRTDGLLTTLDAVRSKLDQPLSLGYSGVGLVEAVGSQVSNFAVGDRVASNGPHAEFVSVPQNLCAAVPDKVSDAEAAFTVLAAVAQQGIRLARPTLGECFVVSGLGLVGLLAVQLLRAQGCRVLGLDPNPRRAELARSFGAETVVLSPLEGPLAAAEVFSRGRGVDGVLIAAATDSSEPVSLAARMCRKRGRIILVGVTGLQLNRTDFYEKELSFQVSCSYGPGRYDPKYEEKGQDYPVGFVRWTAQRNFEAVLDMMAAGKLDVKPLITHRFPLEDAPAAYELLTSDEPHLGILLEYPEHVDVSARTIRLAPPNVSTQPSDALCLGVIGAGNYAGRVLIPALRETEATLHTIANTHGEGAVHYGRKHGFKQATTDVEEIFGNPEIDAVVVATRHDSHAGLVRDALVAGKHVFCEKPLALAFEELEEVQTAWQAAVDRGEPRLLLVGFNRRFSPLVARMKERLEVAREPASFICTVNAGRVPADHWTQDPEVGGGRIIGEACHFIDLLRYLAGAPIARWSVETLGSPAGPSLNDRAAITLGFENGSLGTIHYLSNGHRSFPKERIEAFCAGRVLQLDNFRSLRAYGVRGLGRRRLLRQDKGQRACAAAFVDALRNGGPAPIPFAEFLEVSRVSIEAQAAARR